jgi:hypothetical protein
MFSTRPPSHFGCKERKSPNPTHFGCWIRAAGQNQVVVASTTSYGLRLVSSWTSRKAYKVYFYMDLVSCPYLLWDSCNRWFTTKTFSIHGAASPDFGTMGCVSSRAQQGRVLGFRDNLCRCFTSCPSRGIPKVVSLGEETLRSGTRRCKEHKT